MKRFLLFFSLLLTMLCLTQCSKEVEEPKQKVDGSDVVYLRVDDKEEFLLDSRSKLLHKRTAAKFDDYDNSIVSYDESNINNRVISDFSIYIVPYNAKKAEFKKASLIIRFDKETQALDTAFLRKNLSNNKSSIINFATKKEEYKEYYVDSIIDFKLLKWDLEKQTISFSANCTYSRSPVVTPQNPKIYFYFDLKY
jgi:hypothetical protein